MWGGGQRGEENEWREGKERKKRADKALQYFSKATSILQGQKQTGEDGERNSRKKNLPLGVAEDIVKIIRVRHTLQVHGERFTSNLSLTVKFITG